MERTIQFDRTVTDEKTNFKGEHYPKDIMEDMATYLDIIDAQLGIKRGDGTTLRPHHPLLIKNYIDFNKRNKIDRRNFEDTFGFNTYHRKNTRVPVNGENNEIKGLYVFADVKNDGIQVMNVGISQTIIRRFYQHTCGKMHNQSTLAFYMAMHKHEQNGLKHIGKREEFPYSDYWLECVSAIRNFRFAIVPIENNFQLYMAEVFAACHYRSHWNTFETH